MSQLSRILAAVDFSEPARAAFDQALALSRSHGSELTAVHAVPTHLGFGWQARARIRLIAEFRKMAASSGVRFKVSVQQGDPAGVILLHARSRRPDLIVLGTHQRTGLDRMRSGSIAERVALQATQPVLIVPGRRATHTARTFDKIVVATDFSATATRLLEQADALRSHGTSQVTLVHVVADASLPAVPRFLYRLGTVDGHHLLWRDAWRRLQDSVPGAATTGAAIHPRVVSGDPSREIVRIAGQVHADLIVVGVTRRGAISRRIFGSTAARIARIAAQPILAVPERSAGASLAHEDDSQPLAA